MEPNSGGSGEKKEAQSPVLDVAHLQAALRGAQDAQSSASSTNSTPAVAPAALAAPSEPQVPAAAKISLPVVAQEPVDDFEQAKNDIAAWIRTNPAVQLAMTGLRKDEHIMEFTVGPSNSAFQVIFNENWRPMVRVLFPSLSLSPPLIMGTMMKSYFADF